MKIQTVISKIMSLFLAIMLLASMGIAANAAMYLSPPEAPTLRELETMATSRTIKTRSNTGVKLVLPTEKEMLAAPFRAYTDNGKGYGSIYIMPKPKSGNGYLGTIETGTEVWIVAETQYYYFFVTDDGWLGWNGKPYFSGVADTSFYNQGINYATGNSCPAAPTLKELETMSTSRNIKTKSNTGVKLVLPTEKEMLSVPFRANTDNGKGYGSIYIMPKPKSGNGYLGTVETGTEVWIVAETQYYYFFVTDDGWLGWNGKSYFR